MPHNVVEVDLADWTGNVDNPNGGFSSGAASGATDTFSQTFNTPGQFYYICQPHVLSAMKGTVIVNAPTPTPTPIPTITQRGLIAMGLLMLTAGVMIVRRRRMISA